jgi:type VI secretion system protein ImpE
MNEAKAKLDSGDLGGAVQAALAAVKSSPTDATARRFLFELSCFSGDWERAEKQLDVIGHQDMNAMIGSKIYQQSFKAERDRMQYFSDGLSPEFMTPKPSYIDDLLAANNRVREGNFGEARQMIDEVEENRPAFACKVNGEEFSDFRDYNDLTMCAFETIFKDGYVWLPFDQIKIIEFFRPKSLRDLFWIQGKVELVNGDEGEMFFPALYSGSWKSDNDQVRLGRMTDWRPLGEELFIGEGAKLYWMDGKDRSFLDIESIEFIRGEAAA